MFDENSFSLEAFDQNSFLFDVQAVVSLGAGSGKGPRRKRRFIEEDGKILVFETAEDAQKYLDLKYPKQKKPKKTKLPKPTKVIEISKVEELAKAYEEYQFIPKVYQAELDEDYARLVAIWHKLIEIEDEEILILS